MRDVRLVSSGFGIAAAACLALAPASASASLLQVGTLADLGADDSINWGQLITVPVAETGSYRAPAAVVSGNGRAATVSNLSGPSFVVDGRGGPNLYPGDVGISNCCNFIPPNNDGDLTIRFAAPIRGFGTYLAAISTYTGSVIINGDAASAFSVNGTLATTLSKDFPFLGVISDAVDIYSITFTAVSDADVTRLFSIDTLSLNTTPPPVTPPPPPPSAVPEPATWAMFIGGFGLVGGALRRRQRVAVRFA